MKNRAESINQIVLTLKCKRGYTDIVENLGLEDACIHLHGRLWHKEKHGSYLTS